MLLFSLKTNSAKAAFWLSLLKVGALPITVLLSIVVARALGPQDFGRYAFVLSLATVLAIPAGQGVVALIVRETAQAMQAGEFELMAGIRKRAHHFLAGFTILVWSVGLAYSSFILDASSVVERQCIYTVLLLFPVLSLIAIQAGVLQGLHHALASQVGQIALRPGLALLFVTLSLLLMPGISLRGAFAIQIVATLLALVASFIMLRRLAPSQLIGASPRYEDRAWRSAVLPFALIAFTNTFTAEIGILVLGSYGDEVSAGALRVAISGAQLLSFPLFINNMILSPQAAQMFKSGQIQALALRSRKFARLTFFVSILVGVPLIVFAAPILGFTFGQEYADLATRPLQILALGHLGNVAMGPVGMLLSMSGHEGSALKGQIVALGVVVALALILAPFYGATGAAIAVAVGTLIGRCVLVRLCIKRLKFRPAVI
ncbi:MULTISPECIES: oligosaccharide flippase family protein [Pacificibacter]|uniref:oligosaccharide flippase family protein n=1 Tax=Pacificibacter TaxID=1042323 RepID=UPI001C09B32B|nr:MULTISPECIES: oligosaccharide flippase family protein [Pacificibacter]MBU2937406.1 polysaccharide biosynthesis C-terminal domain-containing protein [Pacificibacter marinus]MDO6617048.1 oligosaccharide flippase family protein [Pacificibacter sp. 1_MG-2023]